MRNSLIIISLLLLTACSKEYANHGFSFEQNDIKKIQVGKTTQQDILNDLGSPTSQSDFGPLTYYYIGSKTEQVSFFDPKTVEQRVLSVTFDKKGLVTETKEMDLNDKKEIAFSKKKTEIKGNTLGPVEQMMSNIGKFNKKSKQF